VAVGSTLAVSVRRLTTPTPPIQNDLKQQRGQEDLKQHFPLVNYPEDEPSDPAERVRRQKKARKYNVKTRVVGPELVQTAEGYHWPAGFPTLPVAASDVIIVGKISKAAAHLSEDQNSVYSELTVDVETVLKNATNVTLPNSVVVERKGGRVRYPSGHESWFFVIGQGLPELGHTYVLFLTTPDGDDSFNIVTGYDLQNGVVEPLDYSPGVVHFERYSGVGASALINDIRSELSKPQP